MSIKPLPRYVSSGGSAGFSLVELMIVVAIIGLLAAIGTTSYKSFKIKARSAEAKVGLGTLFQAQTSFHNEFGFYHSSLKTVGFSMSGQIHFNIGFGRQTNVNPLDYGYGAAIDVAAINTKAICSGPYGTGTDPECQLMTDAPDLTFIATAYEQTFVALAAMDVSTIAQSDENLDPFLENPHPQFFVQNNIESEIPPTQSSFISGENHLLMNFAQSLIFGANANAQLINETTCGLCEADNLILAKLCAENEILPERLVIRGRLLTDPNVKVHAITARTKIVRKYR